MQIFLPAPERFHFEPPVDPSLSWPLIVVLVLNFGILIAGTALAWKLIHG